MRGDVIVKIQEYDARDVRNIDAQNFFRIANNRIRIVVQRDSKMVVASNMRNDAQKSRSPSAIPPYRSEINLLQFDYNEQAGQAAFALPQTNFQTFSDGSSRPNSRISNFSPMPTRDHQQEIREEQAAITAQVILIFFIYFAPRSKNYWKVQSLSCAKLGQRHNFIFFLFRSFSVLNIRRSLRPSIELLLI